MKQYQILITLPDEPISLNEMLNSHWSERSRRAKGLVNRIFALCWIEGWRRDWLPFKRVVVMICNWRGDKDNSIGGCKPIIDALEKNGMIVSDNPKDCKITYRPIKREEKGKSVILLMK